NKRVNIQIRPQEGGEAAFPASPPWEPDSLFQHRVPEGCHLQPHEKALVVLAHRADLGGCHPLKDITAVQAHPGALDIGDKQLSLFQQIRQPAEAVAMGPLDLCDLVEGSRHSGKALLLGHVAEGLVYRVV
ncbi:Fimbrial protein, partial [Dysosmobacter welbionis]